MDDDELKKDDELSGDPIEEDLPEDEILLGGKAKRTREPELGDGDVDVDSIEDLAALEDEDDEPYDDVDNW